MRQLLAYDANESTRRLFEDEMSTGPTNTRTARGFSVLYHVFARKQCILCSADVIKVTLHQAVCVTTHKGSWVKLLLCLILIVTRSSSHLVREGVTNGLCEHSRACHALLFFASTSRNKI